MGHLYVDPSLDCSVCRLRFGEITFPASRNAVSVASVDSDGLHDSRGWQLYDGQGKVLVVPVSGRFSQVVTNDYGRCRGLFGDASESWCSGTMSDIVVLTSNDLPVESNAFERGNPLYARCMRYLFTYPCFFSFQATSSVREQLRLFERRTVRRLFFPLSEADR